MATVFMKWLETSPQKYARGIQILTLGRLERLHAQILTDYVAPGMRVLEIGCGTGTLAARMAHRGATVTAIDASPSMLAEAERQLAGEDFAERPTLKQMDAVLIAEHLPAASFDLIVASLLFSELSADERRYALNSCARLLSPEGRLVIVDEIVPPRFIGRVGYVLVRRPVALVTWLLTRTTTSPMNHVPAQLSQAGFHTRQATAYLGGSLALFEGRLVEDRDAGTPHLTDVRRPRTTPAAEAGLPAGVVGQLHHRISWRTLLKDFWALFFRIPPPYPKVRPGLYALGEPDAEAPVLVTGNFDLTVRRLVQALDGRSHAWVLVADTGGINVWCAAGGRFFTAERVSAALKSSPVETLVNHRTLTLPQLSANGVDGWRVREETGWQVEWGPVRAADIPAYLAAEREKTDAMRWVRFPLKDRLEMVTVTLGFYALLVLVPALIFWRQLFWPITASLVGLSYLYALTMPWLPGRDGLSKSIPLALIGLLGLVAYTFLWNPLPPPRLFNWSLGIVALSVFTAAELQGMSPLMRGEQANWLWELLIAAVLGAMYWLIPLAAGWC